MPPPHTPYLRCSTSSSICGDTSSPIDGRENLNLKRIIWICMCLQRCLWAGWPVRSVIQAACAIVSQCEEPGGWSAHPVSPCTFRQSDGHHLTVLHAMQRGLKCERSRVRLWKGDSAGVITAKCNHAVLLLTVCSPLIEPSGGWMWEEWG